MRTTLAAILLPVFLAGCSVAGIRDGYEEPAFEVTDRLGDAAEVRRYAPRLAAEVTVPSNDSDEGRNAAFRLLFDYISGANRSEADIAMTVPVETAGGGQEIAMTAPVETESLASDQLRMRFFLPSAFNSENAPRPTDQRVRLVEVPAETFAVLRFSGSTGAAAVQTRTEELMALLAGSSWRAAAMPIAYFYDPPWTLPPFRRNEVAIAVEKDPTQGPESTAGG